MISPTTCDRGLGMTRISGSTRRGMVPSMMIVAFAPILPNFFENATVNEWRFLKTVSGAKDQLVRRDFEPVPSAKERLNVCSVPGSLYIALQDNTYFYGYGWNNAVAMRFYRELSQLNKGDLIMLRGDFMYARVAYRANHACAHAYIDTSLFLRPTYQPPDIVALIDDIRLMDDLFCFVWNCPLNGLNMTSLRRHLNRFHGMFFKNRSSQSPKAVFKHFEDAADVKAWTMAVREFHAYIL
ncbi:hypothetical protein GQ600_9259 [Phytophthora cactorum]|nr:hypothetical protein GQ600_9259 [Phytophthora cactorum]